MLNDDLNAKREAFLAKSSQDRLAALNFLNAVVAELKTKHGVVAKILTEPNYRPNALVDFYAELQFADHGLASRINFRDDAEGRGLAVNLTGSAKWTLITGVDAFVEILRDHLDGLYD